MAGADKWWAIVGDDGALIDTVVAVSGKPPWSYPDGEGEARSKDDFVPIKGRPDPWRQSWDADKRKFVDDDAKIAAVDRAAVIARIDDPKRRRARELKERGARALLAGETAPEARAVEIEAEARQIPPAQLAALIVGNADRDRAAYAEAIGHAEAGRVRAAVNGADPQD